VALKQVPTSSCMRFSPGVILAHCFGLLVRVSSPGRPEFSTNAVIYIYIYIFFNPRCLTLSPFLRKPIFLSDPVCSLITEVTPARTSDPFNKRSSITRRNPALDVMCLFWLPGNCLLGENRSVFLNCVGWAGRDWLTALWTLLISARSLLIYFFQVYLLNYLYVLNPLTPNDL
jgi:hypothetical protein